VSDLATPSVKQHSIITFLVTEKVKPTEILHRLNAQYGEESLSHSNVYEWYNKFSEGRKEVLNLLHAHVQPTAVCNVNICCVEGLILGKA
jgi:hypothetical protein